MTYGLALIAAAQLAREGTGVDRVAPPLISVSDKNA
jgi:hypothetical protein